MKIGLLGIRLTELDCFGLALRKNALLFRLGIRVHYCVLVLINFRDKSRDAGESLSNITS